MRVVLVSRYPVDVNKPRGGIESVTVVLAMALARINDTEIHVITLDDKVKMGKTDVVGNIMIHRLPGSPWPQMLDIHCGPGRKLLLKRIYELAPDIVHSHETFGLTLGRIKVPSVFTVHGFDHANIPAEQRRMASLRALMWKIVERRGLARQKHIISISPYVRGMIEPQTNAMIYDVDNPVDNTFFGIKRKETGVKVLCLGWMNERKNTLGSVKAFARALERGVAGTLCIAGEAKNKVYLDKIEKYISRKGINNRVFFLGHIDHAKLKKELATTSVFLLPALQENAPMAISEAMAAGVPVITSNRCGMPYMVEEGKSGFLIEPENTTTITDRLATLMCSAQLRESMGMAGKEIALSRFHPDVVARKTMDIYCSIIGGG